MCIDMSVYWYIYIYIILYVFSLVEEDSAGPDKQAVTFTVLHWRLRYFIHPGEHKLAEACVMTEGLWSGWPWPNISSLG